MGSQFLTYGIPVCFSTVLLFQHLFLNAASFFSQIDLVDDLGRTAFF